ncbi:DUF2075 domain-containing protein [Liquorilactobacillus hordei]|uniref:DUF2075 domain-containing protein n=2 Tax=Liquorilactobacillus hordei TaxID=468911 RepID=UPI0039E9044F
MVDNPIIVDIGYTNSDIRALTQQMGELKTESKFLFSYPTVYIINTEKKSREYAVYVGETNDIVRRTKEHINVDKRDDWLEINSTVNSRMYIIGHKHFNKSLTLDIENRLMLFLTSVPHVKTVFNRRTNQQGDYYTSTEVNEIFSKIWRKLREKNEKLFPLESIVRDSALFKASPFHKLTDEQKNASVVIKSKVTKSLKDNNATRNLVIVEGEAGAGKTVLMSNLFYDFQVGQEYEAKKTFLLVNHDQQQKVYLQIAKKLGINKEYVCKPTHFINTHSEENKADIVIIDEAHLLLTQGKQSYRGHNQLEDIVKRARVVVAVFDEKQILTTEQYWDEEELSKLLDHAEEKDNLIRLKNQLRINADKETINWIRNFIDNGKINVIPENDSKNYKIRIFEKASDLYNEIQEKNRNQKKGISRLVGTYDWEFNRNKLNNQDYWNVNVGDLSIPWNLQLPVEKAKKINYNDISWAEQPQTINEIGSTYTVQGFDLNYVGVIIGPSVKYRNGKIVFDPSKSANKKAIRNRTLRDGSKKSFGEMFIKNELNVLMTRGVNGLYIFAVDEELQNMLLRAAK